MRGIKDLKVKDKTSKVQGDKVKDHLIGGGLKKNDLILKKDKLQNKSGRRYFNV